MIGFIERGYSVCNSLGRSHLNLSGPPRDGRPWPKSIASAQVGFHLLFVTFPQGREPRRPARHDVCRDRNSALTWRDRKSRVRKAHTSPSPSAKCQVSGLPLLFQARLGTRTRIVSKMVVCELYSTCASPVVPHPSTGHAYGCLASEIGRDPAFPTKYDRTELSPRAASPGARPDTPHQKRE